MPSKPKQEALNLVDAIVASRLKVQKVEGAPNPKLEKSTDPHTDPYGVDIGTNNSLAQGQKVPGIGGSSGKFLPVCGGSCLTKPRGSPCPPETHVLRVELASIGNAVLPCVRVEGVLPIPQHLGGFIHFNEIRNDRVPNPKAGSPTTAPNYFQQAASSKLSVYTSC